MKSKENPFKCGHCKQSKDSSAFSKNKQTTSGYNSWCKECISKKHPEYDKRTYSDRKEYKGQYNAKYYQTEKGRFSNSRNAAKSRKHLWELSFEEYQPFIKNSCFYCEGPLDNYGSGLDRIDNNKGYTKDNVLSCCGECNRLRGDRLTVSETLILVKKLKTLRKQQILWPSQKPKKYDYYLGIDCETGGLTNKFTLLQAYFGIYDKNLNLINELKLNIKPKDNMYIVTPEALEVNKINLKEHSLTALTIEEASEKLIIFLHKNKECLDSGFIPIGHNLSFDYDFIFNTLINRADFERFCHHSYLDTKQTSEFLIRAGLIAPESTKLKNLAKYFNLPHEEQKLHDSSYDVKITIQVYEKILNLVKNLKENSNEDSQK